MCGVSYPMSGPVPTFNTGISFLIDDWNTSISGWNMNSEISAPNPKYFNIRRFEQRMPEFITWTYWKGTEAVESTIRPVFKIQSSANVEPVEWEYRISKLIHTK